MAHSKLLKKINDEIETYDFHYEVCKEWLALRAVVELHKPDKDGDCEACFVEFYFGGTFHQDGKFPCATFQAIEQALA